MEPQDNKLLTLQKAINAHEQAAAALTDLMSDASGTRYAAMLARLEENLADLRANVGATQPGDHV